MSTKSDAKEVFIIQSCLSTTRKISTSEGVGQSLNFDTAYNEIIQGQTTFSGIILTKKILHKHWTELISHELKGSAEFHFINITTSILVN